MLPRKQIINNYGIVQILFTKRNYHHRVYVINSKQTTVMDTSPFTL